MIVTANRSHGVGAAVYRWNDEPLARNRLRWYSSGIGTDRPASPSLEAFIDETIKLAKARGYSPTTFVGMRQQYGTIEAIERLVKSSDIQSGFRRLRQLGLLDWTIEAAVIKFSNEFGRHARDCAEWRLAQVKENSLPSTAPSPTPPFGPQPNKKTNSET